MNNTQSASLPSRIASERAIFSIVLLEPELLSKIIDDLSAGDFYSITGQQIWTAITSLYKQGSDIDVVSVNREVEKLDADPGGALAEIAKCYSAQVSSGNLKKFVADVRNASMLRKVVTIFEKHSNAAQSGNSEARELLTAVEKDILELSERVHDERPTAPKGIIKEVHADISKMEGHQWLSFDTGFETLDEKTGGLIPTHVWVLGGYTGCGKTLFALQLALNCLKQGAKVMLFSTEMDRKMNILRMVGNLAKLGTIKMLKGKLDKEETKRMLYAEDRIGRFEDQLTIYDSAYTIEEIRLKAKKQKLQGGLNVLILDFIQNLRGKGKIYERMSQAAIELQGLAQELGITVVIVSQVSQAAADWESGEAISYKGAGEIATIADVALWMGKDKTEKDARWVVLRKVRHGSPARFVVELEFPSGRIKQVSSIGKGGVVGSS